MKRHQEKRKGFPGGLVVRSPPANGGNMGPVPVREDLTCCKATTPEPQLLGPAALQPVTGSRGSGCSKKPAHLSPRAALLAAATEKPTPQRRLSTAKR